MIRGFAEAMKSNRKALGLSMKELSERTGISRSMLFYYESGEFSPSAIRFLKICSALGLDYNIFMKNCVKSNILD